MIGTSRPAASWSLEATGWCAWGALCIAWLLTVLAAPVMPLQDVPDWVHQGWLIDLLIAGDPRAAIVEFKPYPVPNALVSLLAAVLLPLIGADGAARSLAAITLVVVAAGSATLARASGASGWVAALIFALIGLSTPFLYGYLAFTLAMGLLALALAADRRSRLGWPAVMAWSLLLFFTHAVGFAVFVLVIGWRHLLLLRSRVSALALLPAIAIALWYALARLAVGPDLAANALPAAGWLDALWQQLRWKPFTAAAAGPWRELRLDDVPLIALDALGTYWMITANLLFGTCLVVIAARALRRRMRDGETTLVEILPGLLLLALFVLAPPVDFLGMINAGERFWLAACLLLLPLARPRPALVAALMLSSLPAHVLNIAAIWRIGDPPPAATAAAEHVAWHPFIIPVGGREAVLARIRHDDPRPIDPGYATGLLRNR